MPGLGLCPARRIAFFLFLAHTLTTSDDGPFDFLPEYSSLRSRFRMLLGGNGFHTRYIARFGLRWMHKTTS